VVASASSSVGFRFYSVKKTRRRAELPNTIINLDQGRATRWPPKVKIEDDGSAATSGGGSPMILRDSKRGPVLRVQQLPKVARNTKD